VEGLKTNKALKVPCLPKLASFHTGGKGQHLPIMDSLIDLVRLKQNTTLTTVVVNDSQQSDELEFWCRQNQATRFLHQETLALQDAIPIALPQFIWIRLERIVTRLPVFVLGSRFH